MKTLGKTIGFIGAGNMAEAMIGAVLQAGLFAPEEIIASDISPQRRQWMHSRHGVTTVEDNARVFAAGDIVVLAVKPQMMDRALEPITETMAAVDFDRKLVISIAAGITLKRLEALLYRPLPQQRRQRLPILRVMPNTPALVLCGMAGMSANRYASSEDTAVTRAILEAMGRVREFAETDLDAVTALSGSGPAYVYYFIEAMIRGGAALGLEPAAAAELTRATFDGAMKLLAETGEEPAELRRKVTSPGGTTEAALRVFEDKKVDQAIVEAILAAARRSKALSEPPDAVTKHGESDH